jgi:hypothetical protein
MSQSNYDYKPSFAAAGVFAVLFTLSMIGTFIQLVRYRAWVWIVMFIGSLSMHDCTSIVII